MNWLNIEVATIRRPEYVGSDPCHRATWWNLMAFCAEQENGGVIDACGEWKCRRWQQTCGVTKDEAESACDLWTFSDGILTLWGYPVERENEVRKNRESGKRGGSAKTQAKTQAARENGAKGGRPAAKSLTAATDLENNPNDNPSGNPSDNPTERKGKEDKVRERKIRKERSAGEPLSISRKSGSLDDLKSFCREIDMPESDGESMFYHWTANGWKNGSSSVRDWQAGIRKWKSQGWLPSQKAAQAQKPAHRKNEYPQEMLELP